MSNSTWQFQTDQSLVENHGLKLDEFTKIVEGLGREPNLTELGIFSPMCKWNLFCAHKKGLGYFRHLGFLESRLRVRGPRRGPKWFPKMQDYLINPCQKHGFCSKRGHDEN